MLPDVEYFSTNPYGAGSSTSVYRETQPIDESDKEIKPPPTSPLLSNFMKTLLPLPPVPPKEPTTNTETDRIQAMGTLITEAQLQAIVMAAIRTANRDEKNLKTPKQKAFSGWAEDLTNFIQECELRFKVFSTTYSNATKNIFYILSLMNSGTVKVWKDAYINKRRNIAQVAPNNLWTEFWTLLEGSFADPGRSKDVMNQLQTIWQGKELIDPMNTRFCLLLSKANIDLTHNVSLQMQM